jgi:C-terminal peptidase prc
MTRAIGTGVLGCLVLAAVTATAARAAEGHASQPYVVLVGIGRYADKQILPRPHAEDDAKAFYDLLTDKARLGVDPEHVKLLLGGADSKRQSEPATHENILKALHWAATKAGRDDLVIFAFFGQGAPLGERTCYFASDSTYKDRAKNALAAAEIEHELWALKSHRFCAFVDVDFKGYDSGKDAAPELNVDNLYKEYQPKEKERAQTGRILFLANNGLKPSLNLEKHGLFAQVILDGLKGGADREGNEPDGLITVDELVDYVDKQLPELAREHGKTKEEKEQAPWVVGGLASNVVLVKNPKVTAKVQERLEKFNRLAADRELSHELTEEGRNLLERMPKLKAYRSLRKDYQRLADGELSLDDFKAARKKVLDGMKYTEEAARAYAAKVIQASQVVREEYVKNLNQGELVGWAVRGLYQRLDEEMPKDIKARLEGVKELKESELLELLTDVRQRLGSREDLDNHKDLDIALGRMLGHLDPYTSYIDPEQRRQFERDTSGNFTGIGVQIRKDAARDMLQVVTPIKDSPAYKAGLKAGDLITHIKRETDSEGNALDKPELIPAKGLPINDAVKKISGKPGTQVKLVIEREGVDKPLEIEITRGLVEVETVLGAKRKADDNWDYLIDPGSKIAYVRLTQFARNSARDMRRVVNRLVDKQKIKGLVLDLRFNPGGLLPSAVDISDLFVDDGLIVTIRPRIGKQQEYTGEHDGSQLNFPMVCLVNGGSASGSEIVAACLQDQGRALIMGERSYGKGSVQNIMPFEDGQLRLTIASFWRPNGKNLNKGSTSGKEEDTWGVTPDKGYILKLSPKEREALYEYQHNQEIIPRLDVPTKEEVKPEFKDWQLEMALDYLRGQIKTASRLQAKKAG